MSFVPWKSETERADYYQNLYNEQLVICDRLEAELDSSRKHTELWVKKWSEQKEKSKALKLDFDSEKKNYDHLYELYLQRATLCEEQDRKILELEYEIENLKNVLPALPMDTERVVRCKDCKWYGKATCAMDDPYSVSDNNFCSFGTRKVVLANDTNGSSEQT